MRKISLISAIVVSLMLLPSCAHSSQRQEPDAAGHAKVKVHSTPVKDQGASSFCWIYSTLAMIEQEHLMQGDSVNLSVDYLARCLLEDQARLYYLSKGENGFNQRGVGPMAITLLQRYGAMPYDSYKPGKDVDYNVLCRRLERIGKAAVAKRIGMEKYMENIADELNKTIGYLPPNVFMLGAKYTPLEFAHSVCRKDEYVALCSVTHHPFGQNCLLELPDNIAGEEFMNVPLDSLMQRIDNSLLAGHPVMWEGKMTQPETIKEKDGNEMFVMQCADETNTITQQMRQQSIERFETTDDHAMCLIAISKDSAGHNIYLAKNSWGKGFARKGYTWMTEAYLRLYTTAVITKRP